MKPDKENTKYGEKLIFRDVDQVIIYHKKADDEIVLFADRLELRPMRTGEYDVSVYWEGKQIASMMFQADNKSYYYSGDKIELVECEIVLYRGNK